jgi:hypothetical protein
MSAADLEGRVPSPAPSDNDATEEEEVEPKMSFPAAACVAVFCITVRILLIFLKYAFSVVFLDHVVPFRLFRICITKPSQSTGSKHSYGAMGRTDPYPRLFVIFSCVEPTISNLWAKYRVGLDIFEASTLGATVGHLSLFHVLSTYSCFDNRIS